MIIKRFFSNDMKMIRLLLSFLPAWRSLDVVLPETTHAPLGEEAGALIQEAGMKLFEGFQVRMLHLQYGDGHRVFSVHFSNNCDWRSIP